MINTIDELQLGYVPSRALVIFNRQSSNADQPSHYLEAYDFKPTRTGQYELGTGQPVSDELLTNLSQLLNGYQKTTIQELYFGSKIIPSNIHKVQQQGTKTSIVFSLEEPTRRLYFKGINIPDGEVKLPNLVFIFNGTLKVFAYKKGPLTADTPLFKAPFHNTSDSGVCMGSAKIKSKVNTWEELAQAIDDSFFKSIFTHLNGGKRTKKNLDLLLIDCINNKKKFPITQLVSTNITLKKLL